MAEPAAENSRAGVAEGGAEDGELAERLGAEAAQRVRPDDHNRTKKAERDAEGAAPAHALVGGEEVGEDEGEERGGGVENGGQAAVDAGLAPHDEREGQG